MEDRQQRVHRATQELQRQAMIITGFVLLLWLVEIADRLLFRGALDGLGVVPYTVEGLRGILLAPFLHADFAHLAANSVPLAIFGWLILVRGFGRFALITLIVVLSSGVGAWLFGGAQTVHIGASGIVFGYFGFILLRALTERSLASLSSALIVLLLYGSLIWGVLPLVMGVSWQMHLFGFLGGALAARMLPSAPPVPPERDDNLLTIDYDDLEIY